MRAVVLIDVQLDFCPGGALAVPDGDAVVAPCNALAAKAPLVVLTADWHPSGHSSFASSHGLPAFGSIELDYGTQTLWPDHCIQGSAGAAFHPDLHTDGAALIVRKGMNPAIDSYSAFFENDRRTPTGLGAALKELGVTHVELAGLASDYCVKYSALDAKRLGFHTTVHQHATRGIAEASTAQAWSELAAAGIVLAP